MNKEYTKKIIIKLCCQPRSLAFIIRHLKGVDPITAFAFLKELEEENIIRSQDEFWLIEQDAQKEISNFLNPDTQVYLKKYMGDFDFFKKPHPLDFEWRNTKRSVNYLTRLILKELHTSDEILILGMPTLFANMCNADIPQKFTIVEKNKAVTHTLKGLAQSNAKVIEADLFEIDPDQIGSFSTVVMDPPWYEPHFQQFVWIANRCLQLGGRLIISIPPINTRPGIDEERIKWFSYCQKQGLCIENLLAGELEYATPFFEWNASRQSGAETTPIWRKGDLAIFQKLLVAQIERPNHRSVQTEWTEVEINSCRIRIKINNDETSNLEETLEFKDLVPGQILPTVSSRDIRRDHANIWTSGNRIFFTNNPRKFYGYLQDYKESFPSNSKECELAFDFIKFICETENIEHNNYLEWIYYDMEKDNI